MTAHGSVAGAEGAPPIVLLHGLMGRGSTWHRQIPWMRRYGPVFTLDAAFHTGSADAPTALSADDISTERFVADIAESLIRIDKGPAILVGHSMGALHAWCTAAHYPELVAAVVVEDMAPDFVGRTTGSWAPWFADWPAQFTRAQAISMFGLIAGHYFFDAFDDGRLHGELSTWIAIAEHWGHRNYWDEWLRVTAPTLLIEAQFSITPVGQMRLMAQRNCAAQYLFAERAAHLIHDSSPAFYRGAVEAFLAGSIDRR